MIKQKSLGQNFLIDKNSRVIVNTINIKNKSVKKQAI